MITLERLRALHSDSATHIAAMQRIFDRHQVEADQFKGEPGRTQDYIQQTLREARERALGEQGPHRAAIAANAALAAPARRMWESKQLLLSRYSYSSDPGADAAIKTAKLLEYDHLESATLALFAESALQEGSYAGLWSAYVANKAYWGEKSFVPINLDEAIIPAQVEALRLIDETDGQLAQADLLVGMTSGRVSAGTKMALGRRMNGATAVPVVRDNPEGTLPAEHRSSGLQEMARRNRQRAATA